MVPHLFQFKLVFNLLSQKYHSFPSSITRNRAPTTKRSRASGGRDGGQWQSIPFDKVPMTAAALVSAFRVRLA